jgi:hypothetical protein
MKVLRGLGIGMIVVVLASAVYVRGRHRVATAMSEAAANDGRVLMVDDLRAGAGNLRGVTEVQGVVGATSTERRIFGLIDVREVEACGGIDCPEFMLPVNWEGELPALGQTVLVRGQVKTTDGGLLFAASEVTPR